jgi:hypothetical protein
VREMPGTAAQAARRRQDAVSFKEQRLPLLPDFLSAGQALAFGVVHRRPSETRLMWADILFTGIAIGIVTLIAIAPAYFGNRY